MRIVIDTNVMISAIFWTGKPKQLLNKVRNKRVVYLTSKDLLDELKDILIRKDKPFKLSEGEAERAVTGIRELGEMVQTHSQVTVCKDQRDNHVIGCAIDGEAECIVSRDIHLLGLKTFRGVKIITVSDFLNQYGQI